MASIQESQCQSSFHDTQFYFPSQIASYVRYKTLLLFYFGCSFAKRHHSIFNDRVLFFLLESIKLTEPLVTIRLSTRYSIVDVATKDHDEAQTIQIFEPITNYAHISIMSRVNESIDDGMAEAR